MPRGEGVCSESFTRFQKRIVSSFLNALTITIRSRGVKIINCSSTRQRSVPGWCDVTVSVVYIDGVNRVSGYLSVSRKIRNLDQIRAGEGSRRTTSPGQLITSPFPSTPLGDPQTVPQISFSFNLRKDTAIYDIRRPPTSFTYRVCTEFS